MTETYSKNLEKAWVWTHWEREEAKANWGPHRNCLSKSVEQICEKVTPSFHMTKVQNFQFHHIFNLGLLSIPLAENGHGSGLYTLLMDQQRWVKILEGRYSSQKSGHRWEWRKNMALLVLWRIILLVWYLADGNSKSLNSIPDIFLKS